MKGDYHRYLAEFKVGDERKTATEDTMLLSTSPSSTMKSSTSLIKRVPWLNRLLRKQLLSWTPWEKNLTKTARS
uniref:14-3-3 domain-containing protein n=1 Tax=Glycine max TaxID=3847 RepID=C6TGM4_SOYBN|nr:unknown [Glycine max]